MEPPDERQPTPNSDDAMRRWETIRQLSGGLPNGDAAARAHAAPAGRSGGAGRCRERRSSWSRWRRGWP